MTRYRNSFPWTGLLASIAIVAFLGLLVASFIGNLPGATQERALGNARKWAGEAKVETSRLTCVHDSDGDGFSSCTAVTTAAEKIYLQCASGFFGALTGAVGCKEIETTLHLNQKIRR